MEKVVTVILHRDGRHHLTLMSCSREDAERWADEGYQVFLIVARGERWAMNHINSGKLFSHADSPAAGDATPIAVQLLQHKGG